MTDQKTMTAEVAKHHTNVIRENFRDTAKRLALIERDLGYQALGYDSMKAYIGGELAGSYSTIWQWLKHGAVLLQLEDSNLEPAPSHSRQLIKIAPELRVTAYQYAQSWAKAQDKQLTANIVKAACEVVEELAVSGMVSVEGEPDNPRSQMNGAMLEHVYEADMRQRQHYHMVKIAETTAFVNFKRSISVDLALDRDDVGIGQEVKVIVYATETKAAQG